MNRNGKTGGGGEGDGGTAAMAIKGVETLRQFTRGKAKSGGRNSHGRITAFHRGGGAKRLLRRVDLKRGVPGVGIVERIEYDPNRSSKIALVRWIQGGIPRCRQDRRESAVEAELASLREKVLGSATASCDGGGFSFSSLPGKVRQTRVGGIFASMLSSSSQEAKDGEGSLVRLPRMAVAGAKPAFFAARTSGKEGGEAVPLSEVRTWKPESRIWTQRNKRRAAIPWQSVRHHSTLGVSRTAGLSGARKGLGQILEPTSRFPVHSVIGNQLPLSD